ncbi:MAG: succinate dehydrogenase iron-sulfur subunit [Nitrososphaerota archaeon]
MSARSIRLRVYRHDPSSGRGPSYALYEVPLKRGMTVLDALLYVKERLDPTLALRFSCRMAICGSCGMAIDGLPRLACVTQVQELGDREILVEPLPHFPLIRDLVTDFSDFFEKHRRMKPYLIRQDAEEQERAERPYLQTEEELLRYVQFAYCISCGLCYAACPVPGTDELYPGPQALAQLYRYMADSRDQGRRRWEVADDQHGLWRCHFAGSCSLVCPKGVDPALAIQLLRRVALKGADKP